MISSLPELLFDAERRFGPRTALAIRRGLRTETWSYRELAQGARRAAERLRAAGVRPGDRLLVLAPNSPELVVSLFGAWLAGGVLVPIDLRTEPGVIGRMRERTAPRLLIGGEGVEGADGLAQVSVEELARGAGALPLAPGGPLSPCPLPPEFGGKGVEGLAEIVFTSGTTGEPRGVMLTHANILANVASALDAMPIPVGARLLSLLPLSHMMEQTVGLFAALAAGASIYYATSRRSSALAAAMQRHRISLLVGVPQVLSLLLSGIEREVERRGRERRWVAALALADRLPMALRPMLFGGVHARLGGHLRLVLCGGAPLDPDLWRTWERLGVRVVQGYGATECAPIVASNRLDRRLPGSVGWPVCGVEVRLAGDGEVLVRGPNVTPGYWRDEGATAAAFEDGWYRTGDTGSFGQQGDLRLLGRKKEMIVLADGRNVFPGDVEAELKRDAAVRDCVVVGKPTPGGGEQVHAVIIPAEGGEAPLPPNAGGFEAAAAAIRRANGRLGPHQQVTGFSIWPGTDFPRTPSLKVKRAEVLAALDRPAVAAAPTPTGTGGDLASHVLGLVARAAGRPPGEVRPESDLGLDVGLDSLARVELAVLLEEELGRSVPDEEMATLRTVGDLLAAIEGSGASAPAEPLPAWPRSIPARVIRSLIQEHLLFLLLGLLYRSRRVVNRERLDGLAGPVLLIANHSSHLDAPTVLATLPPRLRRRTAVAAAADYFFRRRALAGLVSLVLGAFPFHREGAVSASLAHCGDLADDGFSILIFPEGTRSADGRLQPFKSGIGLLARELRRPVVPIYLDGLHAILPKGRSWPRRGPLAVRVGEPMRVDPSLPNVEAVAALEGALRRLGASRPGAVAERGEQSERPGSATTGLIPTV